jgi:hypothetical protein
VQLLSALRALVREEVREELRAARGDDVGDPVVPIDQRAKSTRRQASEWSRDGRIPGAIKIGKRWHARASAIDSALEAMGEPAPLASARAPLSAANDGDPDRDLLDELGLEVAPVARKARR